MDEPNDKKESKRISFNEYLQQTKGEQVKRGMDIFGNGHDKKRAKIT